VRLHRFYVHDLHNRFGQQELTHEFWLQDEALLKQWLKVFRFNVDSQLVLFSNNNEERLYQITQLGTGAVRLKMITQMKTKIPANDSILLWSMLKKDKNELVLQKGTELGITHFVPLFTERTEKTGFDFSRAERIIIEAAEQSGRGDIPSLRQPTSLRAALTQYGEYDLRIAEQGHEAPCWESKKRAIIIGPEGGWSDVEKALFLEKNILHVALGDLTLRAETACVVASYVLTAL
jgi:16S rRNA (uracil1498-N3)-methyltransferase